MPVAKLGTCGSPNPMKSEGNDILDTLIRHSIGDYIQPISRMGDSTVQWIQLLQPDLPGWPLLPVKVQMKKCEKCSREFCSLINYRRHIRMHRRSLDVNKESHKNRDLLAGFWDKLSLEKTKEVISFDDVTLKEIDGSSVISALASSLCKPVVWSLPSIYAKAGSTLLDVIQMKPYRLPISSQELFSVLDEASEGTFLCAGTAEFVQKYVFDEETAKSSLELQNLASFVCFLFEQQLVRAWVADKDAEALRCHKLLVEEEEAAQKRQAEIFERKKLRMLRQKEQKVKEIYGDLKVAIVSADSNLTSLDVPAIQDPFLESMLYQSEEQERDIEAQLNFSSEPMSSIDKQLTTQHLQFPQSQSISGSRVGQDLQASKPEPIHKLGQSKERPLLNGSKVWTKIFNSNIDAALQGETSAHIDENNCEVIIGSIPVTLRNCIAQHQDEELESCCKEQDVCKDCSEKLIKPDFLKCSNNRAPSKLWRPLSRGEAKISSPDRIMSSEGCTQSETNDDSDPVLSDGNAHQGNLPIDSTAAKEFLSQRWKEAISGEHVKVELSSRPERNVLGNAENQIHRNGQTKFRKKSEKSFKIKYIPKQKAVP